MLSKQIVRILIIQIGDILEVGMMVLPAVEAHLGPLLVGVDHHLPGVPGARDPQDQATLVGAMGIQDTEDR